MKIYRAEFPGFSDFIIPENFRLPAYLTKKVAPKVRKTLILGSFIKFTFDGQLIQQSTKVSNKKDAATIEAACRTQLALGKIGIEPPKKAPAFEKAVEDFLEWSKVEHANKITTYRRYYCDCQILKKYFGQIKVNLIETKDIEKFVVW